MSTVAEMSKLTDDELKNAFGNGNAMEDLQLDSLAYLANRFASFISGHRAEVNRAKTEYREAITIYPYVIYWIVPKNDDAVPVYVGVTRNLSLRWQQHHNKGGVLYKRKDADEFTITVVQTLVCDFSNALIMEFKSIQYARTLNPHLWNKKR